MKILCYPTSINGEYIYIYIFLFSRFFFLRLRVNRAEHGDDRLRVYATWIFNELYFRCAGTVWYKKSLGNLERRFNVIFEVNVDRF